MIDKYNLVDYTLHINNNNACNYLIGNHISLLRQKLEQGSN